MRRLLGLWLLLCAGCAPVPTVAVTPTVAAPTSTATPTVAPTVAVVLPVDVPRIATVGAPATATVVETEADRATRLERDHPATDPRAVSAEPSAFVGQRIHVRGLMTEVSHDSATNLTRVHLLAQVDAESRGSEPIAVELSRDTSLLRGDCRSFFGTLAGEQDGMPLLRATDSLVRYRC